MPDLEEIGITCFAASYAVALVMEVSRLLFRSGIRGAAMLGFAGAGLVAHTAFLYYQAVKPTGSPLSSERDWYLVAAWVLVVAYLYLVYYRPRTAFGLFLLPLVLGLVGTGAFADSQAFAREPASRAWGIIHSVSILLATVSVSIGFVAGLMYLGQARRLKNKRPPIRGLRLPSLEWLQRTNSRTVVISVLMMGMGVISGMILNRFKGQTRSAPLPWYDPLVLSSLLMFAWLLTALVLDALYRPARQGRKVAYLTLVSFVFLVVALGLFLSTRHGGPRKEGEPAEAAGGTVEGSAFRVQGSGFSVQGSAFRVQGSAVGLQAFTDNQPLAPNHCPLPTAHRPLPTAHRPLPTAHCSPPTAHRPPPTVRRGPA